MLELYGARWTNNIRDWAISIVRAWTAYHLHAIYLFVNDTPCTYLQTVTFRRPILEAGRDLRRYQSDPEVAQSRSHHQPVIPTKSRKCLESRSGISYRRSMPLKHVARAGRAADE